MPESETPESDSNPFEANPEPTTQSALGIVRKLVLFGVLGVMFLALIYDYRIARPAVNDAYNMIDKANIKANSNSDVFLTNKDVAEMLGKEPIDRFSDETETVEVYGWASGIPFRQHKLYTVYKPYKQHQLFYRQSIFRYETSDEVAPVAGTVVGSAMTDEERAAYSAKADAQDREYGQERFGSEEIMEERQQAEKEAAEKEAAENEASE